MLYGASTSNMSVDDVDWTVDRGERITFLDMLTKEVERDFRAGNRAAEWRLRCKRQANIINELRKLGPIAELLCGPLLSVCQSGGGGVVHAERFSHFRETLDSSPLMSHMNRVQRGQLFGLKTESWKRLEGAIQSLGHNLCLATKDLYDLSLLAACSDLKVALVIKALGSDWNLDNAISYIKWLTKSCQFCLLRAIPQEPPVDPIIGKEGNLLPFVGQWSFVSDLILGRSRRRNSLTTKQARFLSQLGNAPRAMPHPSVEQTKVDIKTTVDAFTSEHNPSRAALDKYQKGISSIIEDCGEKKPTSAHVSLVSSGKLEASRLQGGGAAILVARTRQYTDRVLDPELLDRLEEKTDQFGQWLIDPLTMIIARRLLGWEGGKPSVYTCHPTVGDILYLKANEIESVWRTTLNSRQRVPVKLAQLLTLTASKLILEVGSYSKEPEIIENIMTFNGRDPPVFTPDELIKCRAGVSIEAGLKSRLTTSGWAAFAHLSQLPANYMRNVLTHDPFVRIGFLDADKLWEVLKIYRKRYSKANPPR